MSRKPKILRSEIIVRFQDCDPYGHLNNSKYLDYFMNAREDQLLDNYELDIYALIKTEGVAWVVTQSQIAYFEAALLMEKLSITTKIIHFDKKRITVEFLMCHSGTDRLKALLWSEFTFFDLRTNRSREHDEKYRMMYEEVIHPVEEKSFPERVAKAKNQGLTLADT